MTTDARLTTTRRPRRLPKPSLMTRDAFEAWFRRMRCDLYVTAPYDLIACRCGDVNCHGWRFVERLGS